MGPLAISCCAIPATKTVCAPPNAYRRRSLCRDTLLPRLRRHATAEFQKRSLPPHKRHPPASRSNPAPSTSDNPTRTLHRRRRADLCAARRDRTGTKDRVGRTTPDTRRCVSATRTRWVCALGEMKTRRREKINCSAHYQKQNKKARTATKVPTYPSPTLLPKNAQRGNEGHDTQTCHAAHRM
jgi:hypothetical protein